MESSTMNMNMTIAMSTEYRLILTKVLEQFDCSTEDILTVWDEAVEEAKEKLESIVQQFKPKSKRKKGKKNGPKRPKSAYIFFCQDKRPEVREQNPEMKATEVTKELGAMWNEIKETDDALEYINLAKEDKVRYNQELENTPAVTSEEDDQENPKKKKKKNKKDGPKKAKSAYIFFCQEKRAEVKEKNDELNPKEITSELGRLWNLIKGTNKAQKYIDMAEEDKERYKNESNNEETKEEPKEKKKPKKQLPKKKEDKEEKKPKKMTAYNLFCKEKFDDVQEDFPTLKKKDIRAKLSEMWKDIKENDKDTFGEYNMRAQCFYDDESEVEPEPQAESEPEPESETESGEETKAQAETKPEVVLPSLSLNNTQLEEEDDDQLEDEVEVDEEPQKEEEDPELTGAKSLLEYLNQVKVNKAKKGYKFNKDEFVETTESLNLSDELMEKIDTFKNGKKTLTVSFLEELITLSQETIESYN